MKRAIQIVVAVAIIGLAVWGWMALHPSPEKAIRPRLNGLAKTLSFKSGSGSLSQAYNAEKASEFFTQDVDVDVNLSGFEPLSIQGRDEVMGIAMKARSRLTSLKVEFPDMNITIDPDGQSAKVNLTGKATVPGERDHCRAKLGEPVRDSESHRLDAARLGREVRCQHENLKVTHR